MCVSLGLLCCIELVCAFRLFVWTWFGLFRLMGGLFGSYLFIFGFWVGYSPGI